MKLHLEKFGWVVAGGLATLLLATGFDTPVLKFGVVDVPKAVTASEPYTKSANDLQAAFKQRQDLIEFVSTYPVFTVVQANRFRELSLKPTPTTADTTELNKIKEDVKAADTKVRTLQQKPAAELTAADKQLLEDVGKRAPLVADLIGTWRREFTDELGSVQDKALSANQDSARKAIQDIGKNQSFTLIFSAEGAPFGVNDITADVTKAMNKK
jgi:Skp family chaperone for outer membrane proteins